jgi:hypothetical protein
MRIVRRTASALAAALALAVAVLSAAPAPTQVIFDTDIGDDCDDAGALAMLHALADRGEIEILAVMISNRAPHAAACADAINTWFGRPDLPLGDIKSAANTQTNDRYATFVAEKFPHSVRSKDDLPDAVQLYRRILADQPDASVVLVAVGPPTNISDLLDSPADAVSPLTGVELVRRKIKFYSSGGNGRANLPRGEAGWNYKWDLAAARNELAKWPETVPFVEAGGSGLTMSTGAGYGQKPAGHIIRSCYEQFHRRSTNLGRATWDQLRLWYAVRDRSLFETSPPGDLTLEADTFIYARSPDRNRRYAYVKDQARLAAEIESLMMHDPK